MTSFVHLSLHTEYSLVDGLLRIKPLMKAVAAAGMPAVALTDRGNLFAMVRFYRAAMAAGVKPIVGVDALIREAGEAPSRLLLLCQDQRGYLNLSHLISQGFIAGQEGGVPMLEREWLSGHSEGLIALSGGHAGDVGQALLRGREELAMERLQFWQALFPERFYLELQRTGRPHEEDHLHAAVALATRSDTPVVATNDVRFLSEADFEAHEARVCIHEGWTLDDPRRERRYTEQQFLRTPEQMAAQFSDIPEALENSIEIAKRCNLELTFGTYYLPDFPIPQGESTESFFVTEAKRGLEQRLLGLLDRDDPGYASKRKPYDERLAREVEVIISMGFPGYFLIVADFIQWAKENGVPVGPGRGSGAGSLVAYALKITDLDPLAYDLLFERFLNPERVSMPDFDVDFCMDGRDRVIDYVARKYGRDRVSQIITYGSMAAKAVVRDVGRVLGHPYGFVDRIAKLIPFEVGMTLEKALAQEPDLDKLYKEDEEVGALIDLARSLEGVARNAGKHAGGVVIAPRPLIEFSPLYCEEGGEGLVTQFDKDDVETIGLVKFDFLGLRTLTIIDWTVQTINQRLLEGQTPFDINTIPLDDAAPFQLLKQCNTTAVFQLESRGMKDLIRRLQPDHFEEIVALVALFRPGPLQSGMVDDFIARKHGRAEIEYPHPALEPILKPTYGVILYQEQVMQIAQELAGYSLGGADLLRRAMGKKKVEEMARQRVIFQEGSGERGVASETATYIFDLMEKFAGYGFNKSHSAAYALVSYQTAYLKAHYPAEFMAAVLSADMDNTDKVVLLIDDCRAQKIEILPPHVNHSEQRFTATDRGIRYGLGAVKGVGDAVIESIVKARGERPFDSLLDLCQRVDVGRVNRRALETLIRAGALDGLGHNRASLFAFVEEALRIAEQASRDQGSGQGDLFGLLDEALPTAEPPQLREWAEGELLNAERDVLGLYLSGHPTDRWRAELIQLAGGRIADRIGAVLAGGEGRREREISVAGLVSAIRLRIGNRGKEAFVTLDDNSGERVEVMLFSEEYERCKTILIKDQVLVIQALGRVDDAGNVRMRAKEVLDLDQARAAQAKALRMTLSEDGEALKGENFVERLNDLLAAHQSDGRCPVLLDYRSGQARGRILLGERWRVRPSESLISGLRELAEEVELLY